MGRPINKKYFGNTNYGSIPPSSDNDIGGEGLSSVNFTVNGFYINRLPAISSMPVPLIPTGIQAIGLLYSRAVVAAVTASGSGYQIGNILTDSNGSTWRVTKLRVLTATLSDTPNSQMFDGGENLVWDSGVNSHWTTATILGNVSSSGNPNYDITGWATFTGGVWDGTDGTLAPTTALTIIGGPNSPNPTNPSYNTRGTGDLRGGSGDNNGNGGKVTFTYGVEAVELVSSVDYVSNGTYNFGALVTSGAGNNACTLTIRYAAHHVVFSEAGSGYIGTEAIGFTTAGAGENLAEGTIVLTSNQQNAIVGIDLNTGLVVDIVRQESSNSYWVQGVAGTMPYRLSLVDPTQSHGLYVKATDSSSKDYWVKKIEAHRVTLGEITGAGQFAENDTTKWTFDTAVAGVSVKIRNAS